MTDLRQTSARPDPAAADSCARLRVQGFCEPGSFREQGSRARTRATALGMAHRRPPGDGVVAGMGAANGRPVAVFAQDGRVLGGSLGETHAAKVAALLDQAGRVRCPVVGLIDSGGARIQEGVAALDGYSAIFRRNVQLSGRVPQVSVILGPCAGGAVYSPALTDLVIMERRGASMFLTGPAVVKAVTHEDVTAAELGGADVHAGRSGVAHVIADGEGAALLAARDLLTYLPSSAWESPPLLPPAAPGPMAAIPASPRRIYDVRGVIHGVIDGDSFRELLPGYARNLVTAFARVEGHPVGVVANQPLSRVGVLDCRAAEKGARFVRMCDAFGIPLLVFVDTPGFLPGTDQENQGVIRRGAKLLYAFAEAAVPRVTVILRKAYGGAYIVMNSKGLGADAVFAWPSAEISVMGAEGALEVLFRRELAAHPECRGDLLARYRAEAVDPGIAVDRLSVDEIIAPAETRAAVADTLRWRIPGIRLGFRHDNLPQ